MGFVMRYFETIFLEEANKLLIMFDSDIVKKVIYNIDLAEQTNDPRLFKKLKENIWEFRTRVAGKQIRLLAFWDKRNTQKTLVVATHGFVKKGSKIPTSEISKAIKIKEKYFQK